MIDIRIELQKAYEDGYGQRDVEIVRCKDCVHCSENGGEDCPLEQIRPVVQLNGFCYLGERRKQWMT